MCCFPNVPAANVDLNTPPVDNTDRKTFPKLNFMCQNVCSLNISKPSKKTHSKLISVTRSAADVVLLSDTRLNSDKQIAGINDIEKKLKFMGYSFFHNSKYRSRGTAILLSKRVVCTIVGRFTDDECNMLLLKLAIGNVTITVGSIYGPNDDDENFFKKLEDGIEALQSDYVVMGGGLGHNL